MAVTTKDGDAIPRRRMEPGGERPAVSLLVRYWLEPSEAAGESAPFRGYARDLKTGEEHYFGDPQRLSEHILRRLDAARREGVADRGTNELKDASG